MKDKPLPITSIRDIAREFGIIDFGTHMKYTELEVVQLVALYIRTQNNRLENAKKVYRKMNEELDKLRNPKLWAFGTKTEAPQEYKTEYLRRIRRRDRDLAQKLQEASNDCEET